MEKENPRSFLEQLSFFPYECPGLMVYVNIDQGIHKRKMKVALNEKRKKLHRFSFYINIAYEAFLLVLKLTKNLFFLKSELRSKK